MSALRIGHHLSVQSDGDEDVCDQTDFNICLAAGFPDCLEVKPVQLGGHVIHLYCRDTLLLGRMAYDCRHFSCSVELTKILCISPAVLVGAAIIRMNPHDQTRNFNGSKGRGRHPTGIQVSLHFFTLTSVASPPSL